MSSLPPSPADNARTIGLAAAALALELLLLGLGAAKRCAVEYLTRGDALASADILDAACSKVRSLGDDLAGRLGPR